MKVLAWVGVTVEGYIAKSVLRAEKEVEEMGMGCVEVESSMIWLRYIIGSELCDLLSGGRAFTYVWSDAFCPFVRLAQPFTGTGRKCWSNVSHSSRLIQKLFLLGVWPNLKWITGSLFERNKLNGNYLQGERNACDQYSGLFIYYFVLN